MAGRPWDHGSGIDRIAGSTFGPRVARKVPLAQYRQILRANLYCQGQQHYERYNGPLNLRRHPGKFHNPLVTGLAIAPAFNKPQR